jgi:bifunctional ADP-heptose synthase (sugar kinase/adenylyltransferase)
MAQNHQMIRIDNEQTDTLSDYDTYVLVQRIVNDLLPAADVVLFEDYDKGVLTPTFIKAAISICTERNIVMSVDPKKNNFLSLQE